MTLYSIALFLHVVGVLGVVVAMGLEWALVVGVRRAEAVQQATDWLVLLPVIRRLSPVSLAVLLVSGVYMMLAVWGGVAWIVVAFVALLLLPPLGMITGLRLPGIARDLAERRGPLPADMRDRLRVPLFQASIQIRTTILLGIVFLMTTKPDATISIVSIVVAVALGVGWSLPALAGARAGGQARDGEPAGVV
jgi:hypothetical protein